MMTKELLEKFLQEWYKSENMLPMTKEEWESAVSTSRSISFSIVGETDGSITVVAYNFSGVAGGQEEHPRPLWNTRKGLSCRYILIRHEAATVIAAKRELGERTASIEDMYHREPNKEVLNAYAGAKGKRNNPPKTSELYHDLAGRLAYRVAMQKMSPAYGVYLDMYDMTSEYRVYPDGVIGIHSSLHKEKKGQRFIDDPRGQRSYCHRTLKVSGNDALHDPTFLAIVERAKNGILGMANETAFSQKRDVTYPDPPARKDSAITKVTAKWILDNAELYTGSEQMTKTANAMVRSSKQNPVRLIQEDRYGVWLKVTLASNRPGKRPATEYRVWIEKNGGDLRRAFCFENNTRARRLRTCGDDTTILLNGVIHAGCNMALGNLKKASAAKSEAGNELVDAARKLQAAAIEYANLLKKTRNLVDKTCKRETSSDSVDIEALLLSNDLKKAIRSGRPKQAITLNDAIASVLTNHQTDKNAA